MAADQDRENIDTGRELSADDEAAGETETSLGQAATSLDATAFVPVMLASAAIGAALAFFMGWQYEKAYLEEWGLSFSAFSYRPYDLMVVSSTTLLLAATTGSGVILGIFGKDLTDAFFEFFGFGSTDPSALSVPPWVIRVMFVLTVVIFTTFITITLVRDEWRVAFAFVWMAMLLAFGIAWLNYRAGSATGGVFLVVIVIAASYFLVAVAPERLGAADAKEDRGDIERLPIAEFVLERSLGIEGERIENGTMVTGPWRIVRVNGGHFWVVLDEDDASEVLQIDEADIVLTRYLKDD